MAATMEKEAKAIDLSHLTPYEEEWVALTNEYKVAAHNKRLGRLRQELGMSADRYSYFYVHQ